MGDEDEVNIYDGILPCQGRQGGMYPQVDISIWLRSCTGDQPETAGQLTGSIPTWLSGSLIQNGPGKFSFGSDVFKHLFDGSAVLQKFTIANGNVHYSCKFVKTKALQKNQKAEKIVIPEFGTTVSKPWWERVKLSRSNVMSDNTMITVYPFDGSLYTFYESPFIYSIDPHTLNTGKREDLGKLGMISHASHVHFDKQGNMITLGMKLSARGPVYAVTSFSRETASAAALEINPTVSASKKATTGPKTSLACRGTELYRVPCRRMFNPGYMHSFATTPRFTVLIEQPLTVSVKKMVSALIRNRPVASTLQWQGTSNVVFHLIDKVTGKKHPIKYTSAAFFYLHTINAYEDGDHVVVDICSYDSPAMMDCMFISELQFAQSNPAYANLFKGRPKRYILPLKINPDRQNQVDLPYTKARANIVKTSALNIVPQVICDDGCETPAINYSQFNGKPYQFFYAITSDVDAENAGKLLKVNAKTGEVLTWCQPNTYCSEPVFVPRPDAKSEDDGVLITSVIRGKPEVRYSGLVVLNAEDLVELGRVEFELPGPVPKPLHGCFLPSWDYNPVY